MKIRSIVLVAVLSILLFLCSGCDIAATMPHSSDEYENGEWSVDELVEHFEGLGFTDIDVEEYTTFNESEVKIQVVVAEDSTSWFPSYRDFEKGETVDTLRKIIIRETRLIPILTIENCPEFAEYVKNGKDSPDNTLPWLSFIDEHNGEALEFDGIITSWSDEFWYITGVDCTVTVENSENMSFYWSVDSLDDLGLSGEDSHNEYSLGEITEGMQLHILAVINYSEDGGLNLEIETMEIME